MQRESIDAAIRQRFSELGSVLNERDRRLWAAVEAKALGYGGISVVARVTGISRRAIDGGLKELSLAPTPWRTQRSRGPGGGRKPLGVTQPDVPAALAALVEPTARGDPESALWWTGKGVRRLATELQEQGVRIERQKVADLLQALGYSLQVKRKTRAGSHHPGRKAQFAHIAARVAAFPARALPVISVDTKKKELVGEFKNPGWEWCLQGHPTRVCVPDFAAKKLGQALPYGIYDLTANLGWVRVGIDHDTAAFAGATLRRGGAKAGAALVSVRAGTVDHGGGRRQHWQAEPPGESGVATVGR